MQLSFRNEHRFETAVHGENIHTCKTLILVIAITLLEISARISVHCGFLNTVMPACRSVRAGEHAHLPVRHALTSISVDKHTYTMHMRLSRTYQY